MLSLYLHVPPIIAVDITVIVKAVLITAADTSAVLTSVITAVISPD
jgi:hypothetical protein